jgi:hypothetical protein
VVDYIVGIALIAAPFVLGFATGGPEMWVPIVLGAGALLYSAMTNYELGLFPTISMGTHLMLDAMSGIVLAISPWVFQFDDVVWAPHLIVGLAEIGIAAMTQTTPRHVGIGRRQHHA